ncbi:MAG: DUF1600 domain-containing protein [Malacoplasma sp.]|nr:DUF1600 domain-containing protein [Malacoplasma sp.]MDE7075541.1 DUF1600 domain-containing protein [Malacoplasma sp.]
MNVNLAETKNEQSKWNLLNLFKSFKWIDWLGFAFFLMYSVTVVFFILDISVELSTNGGYGGWKTIDKFTDQSNILLWLYMLFYLFFRNHSFLKNNQWLISNLVYIFFTFIGYNVILVGLGGYGYRGNFFEIFENAWYHIICPISFFVFGFCFFYFYQNQYPKVFWISLLKQMIYPTIYVIYLISIPFVLDYEDSNGNINHYSVYGDFTNVRDHLTIALPVILGMWLIFFPAAHAIFYFSWFGISKIKKITLN